MPWKWPGVNPLDATRLTSYMPQKWPLKCHGNDLELTPLSPRYSYWTPAYRPGISLCWHSCRLEGWLGSQASSLHPLGGRTPPLSCVTTDWLRGKIWSGCLGQHSGASLVAPAHSTEAGITTVLLFNAPPSHTSTLSWYLSSCNRPLLATLLDSKRVLSCPRCLKCLLMSVANTL